MKNRNVIHFKDRVPQGIPQSSRPTCLLVELDCPTLFLILDSLTLIEIIQVYDSTFQSSKAAILSKYVIAYLMRSERPFLQHRSFVLLRMQTMKRLRGFCGKRIVNWREAIGVDVQRMSIPSRSQREEQGMRCFMMGVLGRLAAQFSRGGYVTGFHCVIKSMYENGFTEHEAYKFAVYLLRDLRLELLYVNQLGKVKELCYVLQVYIFNNLPRLHKFLGRLEISAETYATSWFVTLFSEQLPLRSLNKLWRLFILKGDKMLIKFGIAVLFVHEAEILRQDRSNVYSYLRDILSEMAREREALVWQVMGSIKVTNSMVAHLCSQMKTWDRDTELDVWRIQSRRKHPQPSPLFCSSFF